MSWNNVKAVGSLVIWTDNPDMTQAYLFANGNHQVKLTVALNLMLTDATQPGPTEDEVKAALTLISYDTGAELSHLQYGDKGKYTYVYQPNEVMTINTPVIAASDVGGYQYEIDFYVSSDSTINANYAAEKVAVLITYTGSSGSEIKFATDSNSGSHQSYVSVTTYPPVKYGKSGSNLTPILFHYIDDQASFKRVEWNTVINNLSDESAQIYKVRIDDNNFRITTYQLQDTPVSPTAFLQDRISDDSDRDQYDYEVAHSFFPKENKADSGTINYTTTADFITEKDYFLIEYSIDVHQPPGVLTFARMHTQIKYDDYDYTGPILDSGGEAKLIVFDQFGNSASIEIVDDGDDFLKLSNVS